MPHRLGRYLPSEALAPFVEHYWIVEWNLEGHAPEVQRVLPYPNANLVFDHGQTAIFGVVRRCLRTASSKAPAMCSACAFAWAACAFLDEPMSALTDGTRPARPLLQCDERHAEALVLDAGMTRPW
ncbi:DUF6597 domain-containing transcriptional factor [Cupriavidus basilensis]